MTQAVHRSSEGLKVIMAAIGLVVFVVIALTWIPDLMPELLGGTETQNTVGQAPVRMVK